MNLRKRFSFFRKFLSSAGGIIILSLIALILFIFGDIRQITLLTGLAGVFGGTILTLVVTNITSREAVTQQYAKEANITRKEQYYIPLFTGLKQLHDILEDATHKKRPYPQWIQGVDTEERTAVWGEHPLPSFTQWAIFKEEPYKSNFTNKACKLLNKVQTACIAYNQAVAQAKDPVIHILAPTLDNAFHQWAASEEYKQWLTETNNGTRDSTKPYAAWHWHVRQYVLQPDASQSSAQTIVWFQNLLGWVLANDIEIASVSMHGDYHDNRPPDVVWFKTISRVPGQIYKRLLSSKRLTLLPRAS